jgi:hypothetical protein
MLKDCLSSSSYISIHINRIILRSIQYVELHNILQAPRIFRIPTFSFRIFSLWMSAEPLQNIRKLISCKKHTRKYDRSRHFGFFFVRRFENDSLLALWQTIHYKINVNNYDSYALPLHLKKGCLIFLHSTLISYPFSFLLSRLSLSSRYFQTVLHYFGLN